MLTIVVFNFGFIPHVRLLCLLREPGVDCQPLKQGECGLELRDVHVRSVV